MSDKTDEPLERVDRYGWMTWQDSFADAVRRERCMCLTCERLHPGLPDNCPMAQAFFENCQAHGMALAVTRCAEYVGRRALPGSGDTDRE